MLQNAYLLAKIGADTAENERNLLLSLTYNRYYFVHNILNVLKKKKEYDSGIGKERVL